MKHLITALMILILNLKSFSQELKLVEKNVGTPEAELILISFIDGKESIIKSFKQPLMLYFHYSYYIDNVNRTVYFLSSSNTDIGTNGTMGFRYDLEKFDVKTEKVLFTTYCNVTETYQNKNIYHITSDGFLERNFDGIESKKILSKLESIDNWCD